MKNFPCRPTPILSLPILKRLAPALLLSTALLNSSASASWMFWQGDALTTTQDWFTPGNWNPRPDGSDTPPSSPPTSATQIYVNGATTPLIDQETDEATAQHLSIGYGETYNTPPNFQEGGLTLNAGKLTSEYAMKVGSGHSMGSGIATGRGTLQINGGMAKSELVLVIGDGEATLGLQNNNRATGQGTVELTGGLVHTKFLIVGQAQSELPNKTDGSTMSATGEGKLDIKGGQVIADGILPGGVLTPQNMPQVAIGYAIENTRFNYTPNANTTLATLNASGVVNLSGGELLTPAIGLGFANTVHPAHFTAQATGALNLGASPEESPSPTVGTLRNLEENASPVAILLGDGGTINFNHTLPHYLFEAAISGTGNTESGAVNIWKGTTTLSAQSSYDGPTRVHGGELNLTGHLQNSLVGVTRDGRLSGTGKMKSLNSAGTTAPGSKTQLGSLTVMDSLTFAGNHVYECKVSPELAQSLKSFKTSAKKAVTTKSSLYRSDFISVGGTAALGGAVAVKITGTGFEKGKTYRYKILSANAAIKTAFRGVYDAARTIKAEQYRLRKPKNGVLAKLQKSQSSTSYQFSLEYQGNDVFLTLVNKGSGGFTSTGSAGGVASAIDQIPEHTAELATVHEHLSTLSQPKAERVLNLLSPASTKAVHLAIASSAFIKGESIIGKNRNAIDLPCDHKNSPFQQLINNLNMPAAHMLTRLGSAAPVPASQANQRLGFMPAILSLPDYLNLDLGKAHVWVEGNHRQFTSKDHTRPGTRVSGLKASTNGTQFGGDYQVNDQFKLGLMAGHSHTGYNHRDGTGKGAINNYELGAYGSYALTCRWHLDGVVSYGRNYAKGRRELNIADLSNPAHQKHTENVYSAMAETSYSFELPQKVRIKPFVGGGLVVMDENGYRETGAGNINLQVKGKVRRHVQGHAGLHLSKLFVAKKNPCYVFLKGEAIHQAALGSSDKVTSSFVDQSSSFTVVAGKKSNTFFSPGVGMTALFEDGVYFTAAYDGRLNSNQKIHAGYLKIGKKF